MTGRVAPALSRRRFVALLPLAAAGLARRAGAQGNAAPQDSSSAAADGSTMGGDGYIPVRLPPKAGAIPSMTPDERDAVERQLSCPCPCTLDVFTCRTSMPCGFSPNMHADVVRLVEGGYAGEEIMRAFVGAYGEKVLMAPTKRGFNLVGWAMPFAVIAAGGTGLLFMLRRWRRGTPAMPVRAAGTAAQPGDASAEELARLDAAVRGEDAR